MSDQRDLLGWLSSAAEALESGAETVMSVDVDQIRRSTYAQPWDLAIATDLYVHALSAISRPTPWVASLAISLRASQEVDPRTPTIADLQGDLSDTQPPGLYLMHPRIFIAPWAFDEFRAPVEVGGQLPTAENVTGRYVCFRDAQARHRHWEWSRVVWLDRWPDWAAAANAR